MPGVEQHAIDELTRNMAEHRPDPDAAEKTKGIEEQIDGLKAKLQEHQDQEVQAQLRRIGDRLEDCVAATEAVTETLGEIATSCEDDPREDLVGAAVFAQYWSAASGLFPEVRGGRRGLGPVACAEAWTAADAAVDDYKKARTRQEPDPLLTGAVLPTPAPDRNVFLPVILNAHGG